MSAPKKDGDGSPLPPPERAHEIDLSGDEDPLIVLDADAPPVPRDQLIEIPPAPDPPVRAAAVPAVIDDRPTPPPSPPPPPRARAEYTTEPPSIASDRVREAFDFLPPAAPARRQPSPWPRRAVLIAAGGLLAFGAWAVAARLRPQPPVITSITPSKAEPGQTVTIAGTALGTAADDVVVRFGDRRGPVTSAAGTSLAATVPADLANLPPGPVRVVVEVDGAVSNALFLSIARYPRITGIEPEVALPGAEIAIAGANLESDGIAVRIGGFAAEVIARDGRGLRVRVPPMPVVEGKAVPVDVSLGRESSPPGAIVLGHLPLVTDLAPSSGAVGTTVTIKGHGFAPGLAGNRVTFGTLEALVLEAGPREIRAVVPAFGILESRTALPAVVATGGRRSEALEFTAVRPSGEVFRPRFVAAPAPGGDPERHAVVGTELGPVLVLGGRADAASPGARAEGVAARLNALLEAAASRPVRIEVKESPLQLVAGGTPIVGVTPEDAQGMARGWAGVPGSRVTPPVLARYWAALLQDYLGLFAQRTRPVTTIDFTPHGRVLLDMYSDAERIGRSAGVSAQVVSGMTPARTDAIRRLAYTGPQPGGGTGGLALAGAWDGTLEEGGRSRAIRLQVRLDGSRLRGALTSTAGKVAMGIPLDDLRYDKGMVRFSAVLGGTPMQFRGALEGATLTGTMHAAERTAAVGQFTLRHVE